MRYSFKENRLYYILVIALTIIVPLSIVAAVIVSIESNEDEEEQSLPGPTITWEVSEVSPNEDNPQNFNVTLISNSGSIVTYSDVLSYGISNAGNAIAIHINNGIDIINLNEDTSQTIMFSEESYVGDSGDALSWNYNDEYIAFTALNTNNLTDTRIWIISVDGSSVDFIEASLISRQNESGKVTVDPVYFSPYSNLLLTRSYSEADRLELTSENEEYQLTELPVFLKVFSISGQERDVIEIRDFDESETQIYYNWDVLQENFIEYGVFEADELIDPTNDSVITRVRL